MKKIGILGGTFDPIHLGHIQLAKEALSEYKLDIIMFIPSGNSYMKTGVTGPNCRYEMLQKSIAGYDNFMISDIEIKRIGESYTYETLQLLSDTDYQIATFGERVSYFLIAGADTLFHIETWREPQTIFQYANLIVSGRDDYSISDMEAKANDLSNKYHASIFIMNMDKIDISATMIRSILATDKNIDYDVMSGMLLKKTYQYIKKHHLYGYQQKDFCKSILKDLKHNLKPKRYEHTLRVAEVAMNLAETYGESSHKAQIAALLHDSAKSMPDDVKIALCQDYNMPASDVELRNTELLHAKAGYIIAMRDYSVTDDSVLNAILWHTTGRPKMTMLEKIIFVSDYIEPGRSHSNQLPMLRELVKTDIDEAVYLILSDMMDYLKNKDSEKEIDENTESALQYYTESRN